MIIGWTAYCSHCSYLKKYEDLPKGYNHLHCPMCGWELKFLAQYSDWEEQKPPKHWKPPKKQWP